MRSVWLIPLFACALTGCPKDDAAKGVPAGSVAAAPSMAPTASDAPSAASKSAPPLPAGRSPMPTLVEWNGERKEVTVKGSSSLGCETKMVREYLRIACKGKNDTGGTPKAVSIVKGGHGEALTFAAEGITTLIVPFVDGADFAAAFSWTDVSHLLTMKWPHGAPRPPIIGVFEGAKSPLDGAAAGDQNKLCACFKKLNHATTCEDMMGGADPDCDRTYGDDCEKLVECAAGEPGRPPVCLAGFVNYPPIARCVKTCVSSKECAPGLTCQEGFARHHVCDSD